MLLSTPLEQFRILPLFSDSFAAGDGFFALFAWTNSSFFALFSVFCICVFFGSSVQNAVFGNQRGQFLIEGLYSFVMISLIRENIQKGGKKYFPFVLALFLFIFASNIIGMTPYAFTTTSHIIVTFSIALTAFIGINIVGVRIHGLNILGLFFPPGCPLMLAPLLVLIEIISYFFRVISLSLRLFANMMAGHTLLAILIGFGWTMLDSGSFALTVLHVLPCIVVSAIIGLEFAIAFLQAYVFALLICLYMNDVISLH